ncbi:MAG: Rha family transcriptional regulator [Arcobacteraceae bacterium]
MKNLLITKNDTVVISHIIIAENTDIKESSIRDLITKNINDFMEFGIVQFSELKNQNGGKPKKIYELNEQQYSLLMTYLRNTIKVKEFKKNMVKAFFAMKQKIEQPKLNPKVQELLSNGLDPRIFDLLLQTPGTNQTEDLKGGDKNFVLEIIYQFTQQYHESKESVKAAIDRTESLKSFLNGFAKKHPQFEDYVTTQLQDNTNLRLNYKGMKDYPC